MERFFDNSTWELKTKLWLAYLYSINIICSKKLHKIYVSQSQEIKSVFVSEQASREYNKIGRHLLLTNCNRTSSEDVRIFPVVEKVGKLKKRVMFIKLNVIYVTPPALRDSYFRAIKLAGVFVVSRAS